ncbi:MAG: TonB-dependent receptor plug [Gemmatimonadetes bacterium]|nr:TonB-dependent receptor plug [Gemmatimonadota bacterium]
MRLIPLLLLPVVVTGLQAQVARVEGRVVDSASVPISGAVIQLAGSNRVTRSDTTGFFKLADVHAGSYSLLVAKLGMRPEKRDLRLSDGGIWRSIITMQPMSAVMLATSVTRAQRFKPPEYDSITKFDEFFWRKHVGMGKYFTRKDIEARNTFRMIEVLQDVPGISVAGPNVIGRYNLRIQRCTDGRRIAFYLDGVRVYNDATDFFSLFNVRDVEAMEVYRGVSEIPAEFASQACAAIVVWLKG